MQLTDQDKKIAYSDGFLEIWLIDNKVPVEVMEQFKILASGVERYRDLATALEEDLVKLRDNYNQLTVVSAQYLQFINEQKGMIDQYAAKESKDENIVE